MYEASAETRKATAAAISSGRARRPRAIMVLSSAARSTLSRPRKYSGAALSAMSVAVPPGAMALIVMPRWPSSGARLSTIASTAALLDAYSVWCRKDRLALTDEVSTIRPPSVRRRAACCAANSWPRTFV